MKRIFGVTFAVLISLLTIGCHRDMQAIWTDESGRVPTSCATPSGFSISPSQAQDIAEKTFGKKKVIQHIYADSASYYIVNGFPESHPSTALKTGVRVNGTTGECTRIK